ncbi:SDR family NAD(P)-dependent oxidoreductase [Mesobacterium pallidum]|uniref:SDR family NAD(P)-dependent oxidoreductase n=1 Tax=Mesobacterium pallidum TaxID=2872037 RepID=UPI001EE334E1|nr:SDR family oxidoreductase [Mesobacterium pallidum]
MTRLTGKSIIVTGAARGIGLGIASACRREGARVLAVDIDPSVDTAAERIGATPLTLDICADGAASQAVLAAMQVFGGIDDLVNNAGRVDEADILETSAKLWHDTMRLNLEAPFLWCQAVLPIMLERGGGAIVNVSSIEASQVRPRHFPYVISKSGLNSMTRAIATDFGRRGIRCNTLSPGSVRTEMFETYTAQYPGLAAHLESLNYAGRLGTPEEIGNAAVFLLSDDTPFLNGHDLTVDGARTIAT